MKINNAIFAGSASSEIPPRRRLAEFAFIGRSNVGKSSLINSLCGDSSLAKTSSTPGKTRLINRFLINEQWYLVDLPGYGYARMSLGERQKLQNLIDSYILHSEDLMVLFVLMDCRHPLQEIDRLFIHRLGEESIPFAIILTKCDKMGSIALKRRIDEFNMELSQEWEILPPMFTSSAKTGKGREEILDYISGILNENPLKHATQP